MDQSKAAKQENNTVIFTDSQSATKIILNQKPESNEELVYEIQKIQNEYNETKQTKIHIQWIPSHKKIKGNEIADKAAQQGHSLNQITDLTLDRKTKAKESKKKIENMWENTLKEEYKNTNYGKLNLHEKVNKFLRDKQRKIDTTITRIKIGHTRLNGHLHRMKMVDSNLCRICQTEEETIKHVLFQCPRHYSLQQEMKDTLMKNSINYNLETILSGKNLEERQERIAATSLKKYLTKTGLVDII